MFKVGLLFAAVALILGCSGSKTAGSPTYVRFVEPTPHSILSGLAQVQVDVSVPEVIAQYELGVEGQEPAVFGTITSTLGVNTTALPNGETTFVIRATASSGQQWSDSVQVEISNASHQLVSYQSSSETYAKGEEVVLELIYPVAGLAISADFAQLDDQFDPARVLVTDRGEGHYQLRYAISSRNGAAPGQYSVTLGATDSAEQTVTTPIALKLRERPRLPLEIPGATFVDDDSAPVVVVSDAAAPGIQSISGATQIYSGVPTNLEVQWTQSSEQPVDRIVVRSPDYSGYWVLPIDGTASQKATVPLQLAPRAATSANRSTLELLLGAIDAAGATNAWAPATLAQHAFEPFGTLVTLWWDNPMDIDLEVTTPQGNTIGYDKRSADGGTHQMDSNAVCDLDYFNTERISWPLGAAGKGTYTVRARLHASCGQSTANYHALVSVCGRLQEYSGSFDAGDMNTASATQTLGTFEVDCTKRSHGSVLYRHPKAVSGDELVPAAFIPVRAVTGSGSSLTLWGQGITNEQGQFDFYLQPATPDDYELEIESSWTPPGLTSPQARVVTDPGGTLHARRFAVLATEQSSSLGQRLLLSNHDAAGAFNILDQLRRGYSWVSGHLNAADARKVTPLTAHWSAGHVSALCQTCYDNSDHIYIDGREAFGDEFDDPVLAHEFMHHVMRRSVGIIRGGEHSLHTRATPNLAWNEGVATALGQQSLGSPVYFDINEDWVVFANLEGSYTLLDAPSAFADRGTSNGQMSGNLGEMLVAMVVWDLMDPGGGLGDPFDPIESTQAQTLSSITRHLPRRNRADRGAPGVDLVDFLDGWRCQWPTLAHRDDELRQLLIERMFPYDYSIGVRCK